MLISGMHNMNNAILAIPIDALGNLLWVKDYKQDEKRRHFVKYKSTYNAMPFMETKLMVVDMGQNIAICGDDGTVLYRFSVEWINKLI